MTGLDHEHTAAIDEAAALLAAHAPGHFRPVVPTLRDRFGLTAMEAVTAIREADRIRQEARNGCS